MSSGISEKSYRRPAQAGAHNHECVVPHRRKPPARSDNRDRGYGSPPAAFAKASAAERVRGPAKPWRRRAPGRQWWMARLLRKRHRLDAVAVGVDDKGGVVFDA